MAIGANHFALLKLSKQPFRSRLVNEYRDIAGFVVQMVEIHSLRRVFLTAVDARPGFEFANDCLMTLDPLSPTNGDLPSVALTIPRVAVPGLPGTVLAVLAVGLPARVGGISPPEAGLI